MAGEGEGVAAKAGRIGEEGCWDEKERAGEGGFCGGDG